MKGNRFVSCLIISFFILFNLHAWMFKHKPSHKSIQDSPFQKHEEDFWVRGDVFDGGCAAANLTSHNIAEQMDHILLALQ